MIELAVNEVQENEVPDDVPIINENTDLVPREYKIFNDRLDEADVATDLGVRVTNNANTSTVFSVPKLLNDDDYYSKMERLNDKQRRFMLHILSCVKSDKNLPIQYIVLGSAGVGKSVLIEALHQSLLRHYYATEPNCNPEDMYVQLCASTGKVACNILGITLHSFLKLPINQDSLLPLSSSVKNSLYAKLHKLKFILIDEISMVGSRVLRFTNERLQQIFDNKRPFGGISIIAFGDFNQLKPVMDKPIYKYIKTFVIQ